MPAHPPPIIVESPPITANHHTIPPNPCAIADNPGTITANSRETPPITAFSRAFPFFCQPIAAYTCRYKQNEPVDGQFR
jgi:hypothetical protein